MRRLIVVLFILLTLTSCNIIFSPAPDVWIEPSGLGPYEMRPTVAWDVSGLDVVREFRITTDGPGHDSVVEELPSTARTYRPEAFLSTGTYSFSVESKSASGIWSKRASVEASVVSIGRFDPDDPLFAEPADYDPYFGDAVQWNLEQIHLPRLWGLIRTLETGSQEAVSVAVVDTGYTEHPDIVSTMDTASGYDFISDYVLRTDGTREYYYSQDGDGLDPDATDEGDGYAGYGNSWHGTGVASVIAASTDNQEGLAGVAAPDALGGDYVTHVPIRVLGIQGGTTWDIGQGIAYAAGLESYLEEFTGELPQKPAKIINLSLGAGLPGQPLYNDPAVVPILEAAAEKGAILVAAAGNEREYGAVEVTFPANSPYVLSVGASTYGEEVADYSNPGSFTDEVPTIDLIAPGGGPPYMLAPDESTGILSWYEYVITASPDPEAEQPLVTEDYSYYGTAGTSIAAPHVSGVLAILASIDPSALDLDTARYILKHSSRDIGPTGWDADSGFGLLDAVDAYAVFREIIDGTAEVSRAQPAAVNARIRMGEPGIAPEGPIDPSTLLVSFRSAIDAELADMVGVSGTRALKPGFGPADRLVVLTEGSDPEVERDRLLSRDDVDLVFYNYRYRPL